MKANEWSEKKKKCRQISLHWWSLAKSNLLGISPVLGWKGKPVYVFPLGEAAITLVPSSGTQISLQLRWVLLLVHWRNASLHWCLVKGPLTLRSGGELTLTLLASEEITTYILITFREGMHYLIEVKRKNAPFQWVSVGWMPLSVGQVVRLQLLDS